MPPFSIPETANTAWRCDKKETTVMTKMTTKRGVEITVARYETPAAARRSASAAQRKLYHMSVWSLPGGGYDLFPLGHPVPAGSERVAVE